MRTVLRPQPQPHCAQGQGQGQGMLRAVPEQLKHFHLRLELRLVLGVLAKTHAKPVTQTVATPLWSTDPTIQTLPATTVWVAFLSSGGGFSHQHETLDGAIVALPLSSVDRTGYAFTQLHGAPAFVLEQLDCTERYLDPFLPPRPPLVKTAART
jgi:hypothetical protein